MKIILYSLQIPVKPVWFSEWQVCNPSIQFMIYESLLKHLRTKQASKKPGLKNITALEVSLICGLSVIFFNLLEFVWSTSIHFFNVDVKYFWRQFFFHYLSRNSRSIKPRSHMVCHLHFVCQNSIFYLERVFEIWIKFKEHWIVFKNHVYTWLDASVTKLHWWLDISCLNFDVEYNFLGKICKFLQNRNLSLNQDSKFG